MFSKLALFFAAIMAVFVVALPRPGGESGITNSCDGGQDYCCNSFQPATSKAAQEKILGLGAIVPVSDTVGLTCTPLNVLALNKQSCTTQSACCTGNKFDGALVVGCSPVNVGGP